jgi:hypothetical protein
MALDSKNNIKSVFIVPELAEVTSGTITPGSTGATGSVVVANMSNEVLTAVTVTDYSKIKIIKDRGANLPLQQVILNLNDIVAYTGVAGEAATEQVDYIGYNGTSGSIRVAANNFYTVKLEHVPNSFAYGKRPANYKYGTYQSPLGLVQDSVGQGNIATGLVKSLIQNFVPNRSIDWRVKAELTNSGSSIAITGAPTSYKFTRWSKVVTYIGTDPVNLVANTYLRVGTTAADPIYKVTSVNTATNTITLDTAYQGETATILAAGATVIIVASIGADWGIKITGIKQKYDVNRWRQYDKVRFNTFLEGFPNDATPTTVTTTAAFDGVAVYEQVANDEYISWGDEGQIFVDQTPPLFREQDAEIGTQYNPVVLGWLNNLPSLIGAGENKGQAIFYIAGSPILTDQGLTLVEVLNAWLTGKFTALPTTLV